MKRLLLCFFLLFPVCAFAFDVKQLEDYPFVTAKTFTKSDSMEVNRYIQSTQGLEDLFGQKRVDSKTKYVYSGDNLVEIHGDSSWRYFFPESWKGKGKGKLIYDQNDVMRTAVDGDTLVVARHNDNGVLLVLIKKGHPSIPKVYEHILSSVGEKSQPEEQKSWLSRLFSGSDKVKPTDDAEEKKDAEDDLGDQDKTAAVRNRMIDSKDVEKFDFEMSRNKTTGKIIINGKITEWDDGDSFFVTPMYEIRLMGLDAPEWDQKCTNAKGNKYDCGTAALTQFKKIVGRGRVACEIRYTDKYRRYLSNCENSKGESLACEMVKTGHAIRNGRTCFDQEKEAKDAKIGIWQGEFLNPKKHRDTWTEPEGGKKKSK